MTKPLRNRTALVTGASRGIGRAVALHLAEAGCHLALTGRDREALEATAAACREHGVSAHSLPADLARREECRYAVDEAVAALGGLDILINNAGVPGSGRAGETAPEDWDLTLAVNIRAPMDITTLALPHIVKSEAGAVIFLASIAGKMSFAGGGAYCASKHAVPGFAGSVFEDVREHGVKVCAISPGFVNTGLVASKNLDADKMIQPEDVADTVLWICQTPANVCPTQITLRPQRTPYR
jgi:3-oxoacyl-[acyl-carrier protein] reductase